MKSLLTFSMIALATGALSLFAQNQAAGNGRPAVSIIPLKQFQFNKDLAGDIGRAGITFDQNQVYVFTPDGVVLASSSLASDFHSIFDTQNGVVGSISVYNHVLYVLTNPDDAESPDHAMWESKDQGNSFIAIDDGLQSCIGSTCFYMPATQLYAQGDLLFSNAGAGFNLLVSRDEGATWIPLSGTLEPQTCYSSPFAIVGSTVVQGGECPLDHAFLSRGILDQSMLYFASNLEPVKMPELTNRKIYVIGNQPGTSNMLAGAEGALLRSTDDGKTWKTVIELPEGDTSYPYVQSLLSSSRKAGLTLAAGFNKAQEAQPYLTYSSNQNGKWTDISSMLGNIESGSVSDLKEDPFGRLIAVVIDANAKTMTLDEVRIQR